MTRDPLAGVQTALEECQAYLAHHSRAAFDARTFAPVNPEAELLTEVQVGLQLLREVRERKAA